MENEKVETSELEAALSDFCHFFAYPEVKEEIWYCVMTALGKEGSLYDDAQERVRLLFIYEKLDRLLEIIYRREAERQLLERIKSTTHGEDTRTEGTGEGDRKD